MKLKSTANKDLRSICTEQLPMGRMVSMPMEEWARAHFTSQNDVCIFNYQGL